MKHKCIRLLLLLALVTAMLVPSAWAADEVDNFLDAMESFQTEVTVGVRDFEELLRQAFTRDPKSFFYYAGCSYVSTQDGLEITLSYKNTDISRDEIYVVTSDEQMMAVVGLLSADKGTTAYAVTGDGYAPTDEVMDDMGDWLSADYYMVWCGSKYFGYTWSEDPTGTVRSYIIELNYWNDADSATVATWRDEAEAAILQLAGSLFAQDMPDYYKAYLIHDYLVDSCTYNSDGVTVLNWEDHIPYGALIKQLCVCQGYAEAFRMLMQAAGVECVSISGTAGGDNHMWNAVELEGEWYLVDTTWDDPVTDDGSAVKVYDYFLVTSDQLAQDHQWDTSTAQACTSTDLNYETVKQLVESDTNTYTDYNTSQVRTQAMERAELEVLLGQSNTQADTQQAEESQDQEDDAQVANTTEPEDTTQQEDTTDPADTTEPDDTADPEDTTQPEETADPDDTGADEEDQNLLPVIKLKETTQRQALTLNQLVIAILIALAVGVGLALLVFHLVSASRVQKARSQRLIQREQRVANAFRGRRKRF